MVFESFSQPQRIICASLFKGEKGGLEKRPREREGRLIDPEQKSKLLLPSVCGAIFLHNNHNNTHAYKCGGMMKNVTKKRAPSIMQLQNFHSVYRLGPCSLADGMT